MAVAGTGEILLGKSIFGMNPKQITKFTFYLMVKNDPFLQNFGKYK